MSQIAITCFNHVSQIAITCPRAMTPVKRGFDSFYGFYNGALDYYDKTVPDVKGGQSFDKGAFDFR